MSEQCSYPSIRAWDTKFRRMIIIIGMNMEKKILTACEKKDYPNWASVYNFDQLKFMRGTGFHDKNGIEIFEGDIIDVDYSNDKRINAHEQAVVNWETNSLMFTACFGDDTLPLSIYKDEQERLEIVGNKYENPQIIKNKGDNLMENLSGCSNEALYKVLFGKYHPAKHFTEDDYVKEWNSRLRKGMKFTTGVDPVGTPIENISIDKKRKTRDKQKKDNKL